MAMSAPAMSIREQNARRFMGIAATLGVVGVAISLGGADSLLPKLVLAAGLITLIWSIHRFGRLGPEPAITFSKPEAAPSLRKKKRKKKRASPEEAPTAASNEGDSSSE
jgi:hypothetical protein